MEPEKKYEFQITFNASNIKWISDFLEEAGVTAHEKKVATHATYVTVVTGLNNKKFRDTYVKYMNETKCVGVLIFNHVDK
jgi:hypothetical protein